MTEIIETKNYKKILIKTAIIIGIYLGMKFLLPIVWPFVIAFFVVAFLYPYIQRVTKKTHINTGVLTASILVLILLPVVMICILLCSKILASLGSLISQIGGMQRDLESQIGQCCTFLEAGLGIEADAIEYFILDKISLCTAALQKNATPFFMGKSVSYMVCMASAFAGILITLIAIVLLMKDYGEIWKIIRKYAFIIKVYEILWKVGHLVFIFLRAQLVIMVVTALIAGGGFLMLGIKNVVTMAILTSFLDLLPFIGTGIIMVPLALWHLLQGKLIQAGGFILLYAICAFAREYLEPKLIGKKLGIYPIGILFSIYVGIKLFGFIGIILGPVMMLLVLEVVQLRVE